MAVCLAKRSTRVSSSRCSSSTINTHLSRRRHRNGSAIIVTRAQQSSRDEDLSSMDMGELVRAMEVAAASELYSEASAYRDEYNARLQTVVGQVEDCNARFYKAFSMSDIDAMRDVWGEGDHVQCIHPGSACVATSDHVAESWKVILGGDGGSFAISLEDVRVTASDSFGVVTCVEVMQRGEMFGKMTATNVFERQNGVWKIVHHHAGPVGT